MAIDPRTQRAPFVETPRSSGVVTPAGVDPVAGATAAEMARRRFGGPTRVVSTSVTLTTAPSTVLAPNPRRVFWTVINRGVVSAAVDIDSGMTFANGILIGAAGGFVQSDVEEDGETVGWAVFGACESGTCVVRVLEVTRV